MQFGLLAKLSSTGGKQTPVQKSTSEIDVDLLHPLLLEYIRELLNSSINSHSREFHNFYNLNQHGYTSISAPGM
jgi:hypothetical protein